MLTFFVAFISSALTGMVGGGGGFVMAPYWLITGPPAHAPRFGNGRPGGEGHDARLSFGRFLDGIGIKEILK